MSRPYNAQPSTRRFYVPMTLESDFDSFLENDIPGSVGDFVLLRNWYDQFEEGYEESTIRGEIYPDATKSRYTNTDNNLNFRASRSSGIRKGDMIIDDEGTVFLFDWDISPEPNNRATRALRCNTRLTFKRIFDDEVDIDGYLIREGGPRVIVDSIPVNAYRYDGRPEYAIRSGTPGVAPDALTLMSVQYNPRTDDLRIDDEFEWGYETYRIVDISLAGVNLDRGHGVMKLQTMKKAGGEK